MKEEVSMLLEPARAFLMQIGEFLPKLLLAAVVLVVGWLLAKAVRFAVTRGLRAINFHVLGERAGIDGFLKEGGIETDTVGILALLVFWLVVLAALIIGFNSLGLTYITDLLGRIALFLPHVIVAVLILAFGSYFAQFVGNTVTSYCRSAQVRDAELLGILARYAILTFVVLIARPSQHRRRDRAGELPDHPGGGGAGPRARLRDRRAEAGRGTAGALVADVPERGRRERATIGGVRPGGSCTIGKH
jgi:hypothetical protein